MTEMSTKKLVSECQHRGICLFARDDGNLSIDAPQGALTPEILGQLRIHKLDIIRVLRLRTRQVVEREAGSVSPNLLHGRRRMVEVEEVDPPDPCSACGSLELWETLLGSWRCLRCDPPTKSDALRKLAARIRKRQNVRLR